LKLPHVLAVALCVLALFHARTLTSGLEWPAFDVQYREMAAAQAVLEGAGGADPDYRGESSWYNPMSGWILATAARATGIPLPALTVQIGPWIDLLAPLAFYLLVAALFDPWAALAALGAFLFMTGNAFPFTDAATYSPWFAPENYGQGLFYVALLWMHRSAWGTPSRGAALVLGALLRTVFLVHTAPTLLLGCVLLVATTLEIRRARRAGPVLRALAVTLSAALVVSAPIAVNVIGRYRAHVVNPFPSVSPNPIFGSFSALLITLLTATPLVVAAVAFGARSFRRPPGLPPVLQAWIVATGGLLAWTAVYVVARRAGWKGVPAMPVPGFHFVCYALALVSVGFGVAAGDLAAWGSRRLAAAGRVVPRSAIVVLIVAVVLVASAPRYVRRPDATALLDEARALQAAFPAGLYHWIRRATSPNDVFLCTDAESLFVVSPAGRKVVATNRYFSNPFVDWTTRDHDRDSMYAALARKDTGGFERLAGQYDVRYVVVPAGLSEELRRFAGIPRDRAPTLTPADVEGTASLERAFADERYSVYRVARQAAASQ
jgi:hypothetical protein